MGERVRDLIKCSNIKKKVFATGNLKEKLSFKNKIQRSNWIYRSINYPLAQKKEKEEKIATDNLIWSEYNQIEPGSAKPHSPSPTKVKFMVGSRETLPYLSTGYTIHHQRGQERGDSNALIGSSHLPCMLQVPSWIKASGLVDNSQSMHWNRISYKRCKLVTYFKFYRQKFTLSNMSAIQSSNQASFMAVCKVLYQIYGLNLQSKRYEQP